MGSSNPQAAVRPPGSGPPPTLRVVRSDPQSLRYRWHEFLRQGVPAIWFSSLMVLCILLLLGGMITLIVAKGLRHFWPSPIVQVETASGAYLGPVQQVNEVPASATPQAGEAQRSRLLLKIGNRDLYGSDFRWFDFADITKRTMPADAIVLERREYGDFHGYLRQVQHGEQVLGTGPGAWETLQREIAAAADEQHRLRDVEARLEDARRPLTHLEGELATRQRSRRTPTTESAQRLETLPKEIDATSLRLAPELQVLELERDKLEADLASRTALMTSADGREKSVRLDGIVRASRPNQMSTPQRAAQYASKLREFLFALPRESNTEGGIFPALFGTVLMVMLMTVAVVPLGVIAALYLHEYAKQGLVLRLVRLAVNNLAGVPSIVFGMFGLAFFVYGLGGTIDRTFFADSLPNPTFGTGGILWASLTLALLTLPVVIVATEEGLSAVPRANREASLALGATQWQTLRNVVLPNAVPGILTGLILAVSRGAGEVAPLMITGVVKLAPALPLDGGFPFLHLERKFMHLGFHIYDVSMQSPNVEAAKPMVYATTLLLLVLVVALNLTAILVRNSMRRRYRGAAL